MLKQLVFVQTGRRTFDVQRSPVLNEDDKIVGAIVHDRDDIGPWPRGRQGRWRFESVSNLTQFNNEMLRELVDAVEYLNQAERNGAVEFNL